MRRRKPDLIVPIRDRRQGRRILTLRNLGSAALVLSVVFLVITIHSEMRKPAPGQYGGLFSRHIGPAEAAPPKPKLEVVTEAPVGDQPAADPTLLAPAAREQYLGVNAPPAAPPPAPQASTAEDFAKPQPT